MHSGHIPKELREAKRWVCWRHEDGRKIPISGNNLGRAKSNDSRTWASFEVCQTRLSEPANKLTGLGFMLGDGFTGIDIDNCVFMGAINPTVIEIIEKFASYTEYSPSGKGIHIFVKGDIGSGRKNGGIEVYSGFRYFTVTSVRIGDWQTVEDRQELLDQYCKEWFAERKPEPEPQAISTDPSVASSRQIEGAREWLAQRKGSQQGKGADDYCYALACELLWGWDLSQEDAFPLLQNWGQKESNLDKNGNFYPWNEAEIIHKLRDATGKPNPDGKPKGYLLSQYLSQRIPAEFEERWETQYKVGIEDLGDGLPVQSKWEVPSILIHIARGKDHYDWIIENKLRKGVLGIIGGDAKAGKTTFIYNTFQDGIVLGTCWGEKFELCPVIHLDYETDPTYIRNNIFNVRNYTKTDFEKLGKYLFATDGTNESERLRLPPFLTIGYLNEIIKPHKEAGIIIPDTLRGAFSSCPELGAIEGWDMKAQKVREVLQPFVSWCHKTNWTILFPAHNNKGGSLYGSVDFRGVADQVFTLNRAKDNDGNLTTETTITHEGRMRAIPEMKFQFNNGFYDYLGGKADVKDLELLMFMQNFIDAITLRTAETMTKFGTTKVWKLKNRAMELPIGTYPRLVERNIGSGTKPSYFQMITKPE